MDPVDDLDELFGDPVNSTVGMWLGLRPSVMIVEVCQDCGAYRIVRKHKM